MKRLSTVCGLVVAMTSCTVHQDDWALEFGVTFCKHEQECRRVSTSVDCTRPGYWDGWPWELEAVREGLLGYSPADARRCVDLISKVGCIDNLKGRLFQSAECRAAFPGRVAEGEPCLPSAPEFCARDLKCEELPTAQSGCGTCVPTARASEEVTSSDRSKDCGVGLYPVPDGGHEGPFSIGVCQPKLSTGESCGLARPCLEWLDCSSYGPDGGTCVTPAPPAAGAGEPGEGCRDPSSRQPSCAWPARCEDSRCVDRSARVGAACTDATPCESFGLCVDGICTAPAQAGERCERARCAYPFVCENGVCQSGLALYCR